MILSDPIRFMFVSYPVNRLLVRRCRFRPVWIFEHVQNFSQDKMDREARLMYGSYVVSVRGDEFCHRITKFCMFYLFSLCNKSICRSDQALKVWIIQSFSGFNICKGTFRHLCKLLPQISLCNPRLHFTTTVKPVLETTCIKRPPALRDHCSDTTTLLKS